jgi:sigma-B regulation protein RsbU (phosphoserine phosphatase)
MQDVFCDPARLAQLLSNLLSGMIGLGGDNQPIKVSAKTGEGTFELKVANAQAVVPPETLAQFFQPYARQGDRPVRAGRELGLYIAAEIARAHDGSLTASSSAEGGTAFTFSCCIGPQQLG